MSIAAEFETSVAVAGQLATATFAAWAASVVLCGPLSDSLGRRPIALTGLGFLTASTIGCAFAPNLAVLLLLRVLAGLAGGMIPPNGLAAVSEVISPEKRAQAVGGLMAFNIFMAAICVPGVALLAEWLGWRATLLAWGIVLATALVLNWLWFPRDSATRVRDFSFLSRFKELLSLRFFRAAIFVVVSQRIAYWAIVSYLAAFLIQTYGLSLGSVAAPLAIAAAGQVVGSYATSYVAGSRHRSTLIAASILVGGLCGLVFFSVPLGLWYAVALAAVGTGVLSIPFPTLAAVSTQHSGQSRATGIGLLGLGNQSGGAGGAALAGVLLATTGFHAVGYLCLGVSLASALVAALLMRQPSGNSAQPKRTSPQVDQSQQEN